jgi:hypothetical protein
LPPNECRLSSWRAFRNFWRTTPANRSWRQGRAYHQHSQDQNFHFTESDGSDGSPRAWHIDVSEDQREAETRFLKNEVYQREVDIPVRQLTAWDRFFPPHLVRAPIYGQQDRDGRYSGTAKTPA